jgi:hypothetical protein
VCVYFGGGGRWAGLRGLDDGGWWMGDGGWGDLADDRGCRWRDVLPCVIYARKKSVPTHAGHAPASRSWLSSNILLAPFFLPS